MSENVYLKLRSLYVTHSLFSTFNKNIVSCGIENHVPNGVTIDFQIIVLYITLLIICGST